MEPKRPVERTLQHGTTETKMADTVTLEALGLGTEVAVLSEHHFRQGEEV